MREVNRFSPDGEESHSPVRDARPSGEDRLDSWKEIAEYLKRSVRTVRQWEAEERLPVHRHVHQNAGTVYAFRHELDAWLTSRTSQPAPSAQEEPAVGAPDVAAPWRKSRFAVKRPAVFVAVVAVAALLCAMIWQFRSVLRVTPVAIGSLAVLPLTNLTGDPSQAYLAAGLTDELITELAQNSTLRVISRTSIIQYKEVPPNRLPEIARELNVDAVVEGSIVPSGTGLRINAQLIDARSDNHVWAQTYDREPNDLVGLPHDVARAIEKAVDTTPAVGSRDPRAAAQPIDPDAYTLFFKSLVSASAGTQEGFQDAISYCRHATEKAPAFAAAYARMSLYYLQFSFFGNIAPKQFMPPAEFAARRAIELDDSLPEAHAVLGAVLYRYRWEWSESEEEFRRALTLNSNYAEGHRMFSAFLSTAGRPAEAIAEAQRARDLDPLSVQAALNLGQAYRVAGQYDQAIELFRSCRQKDPRLARVHYQLGHAYMEKGMPRDGIPEFETAVELSHHRNAIFLSSLGYAYARAGRTGEAQTILDELQALGDREYVPPTAIARLYVGLGDKRAAHPWIEKAFLERDLDLISTHADIGLAQLRSDPDFHDIFARPGLVH